MAKKEDFEKALEELREVVNAFLMKQGGLSNGYSTFMEGEVRERCYSDIKWCTPKQEDLTGVQVKKLGYTCYNSLRKVAEKHGLSLVRITHRHVSDGCFETFVEIVISGSVCLQAPKQKG